MTNDGPKGRHEGRARTGVRLAAALGLLALGGAPAAAVAQAASHGQPGSHAQPGSGSDTAEGLRAVPTIAAGVAFPLIGLNTYGLATSYRAGVDLRLPGSRSVELAVFATWTPSTMTGARLDLVSVQGGLRWRPQPRLGFYTLVTAGLAGAREALDVDLGQRRVTERVYSGGLGTTLGLGWTLFEHVDVELTYQQAVLAPDRGALALGTFGAMVGGRL